MGVSDIMIALPGLPLIMVLAAIFEPKNPYLVGIVLTVNAWAGLARSIRSEVLSIKNNGYVKASQIMGIPSWRVIVNDVLPNLMPYILISFVRNGRTVIVGSVALYFLGVLSVSNLNWGVTMNVAYNESTAVYNLDVAHWLIVPLVTIILLSLGLVLIAQGADRLFYPLVRADEDDSPHSD
jgi:peptide/nickel transport system permease protein